MAGSAEHHKVLLRHTGDLKLAFRTALTSLGAELLAAEVITDEQYDDIRNPQRPANDRAADLVRYVQDKVRRSPQHYYTFIGVLKNDESEYRDILAKLERSQPREGGDDQQPTPGAVPARAVTFSSSMSVEDFFKWLSSKGIGEKDCKTLSDNGITPSGIIECAADDFDDIGLTKFGKKALLKVLSEIKGQQDRASGALATPKAQNPPTSPAADAKFEKLPSADELELFKYTDKGVKKKLHIINRASHKWRKIISLISNDANAANKVEEKHRGDAEECLKMVFTEYFINKKPQRYSHDWNGLIELLEDVDLETLADDVRYAVSGGMVQGHTA